MTLKERIHAAISWVTALFGEIPDDIKKYAAEALKITKAVKAALDGDFAAGLVSIIPGDWDDKLRAAAQTLVSEFAKLFAAIAASDAPQEAKEAAKNALLSKLQSKLIALQDNNELQEHQYDAYAQATYSGTKPVV